MKLELETVTDCPVCHKQEFLPALECKDHLVSKETFSIVSCSGCGLHLTSPRPTANTIGQYYKSDDYISHSDSKKGVINWAYHHVRSISLKQKLGHIRRFSSGKRLLDNGAGSGDFVSFMIANGFDCVGIEPDPDARSLALSKHNIELRDPITLNNMSNIERFDVITMWHVLEHIHEPVRLLGQLRSMLSDGGVLFLAVPNHKCKDAQVYKGSWAAYDLPRHLFHFSKETLTKTAAASGFKVVEVLPMVYDSYYVSMLSEKNRGGSVLGGVINGLRSNLAARFQNGEYSSHIYVLHQTKQNKPS